MIPRRLPLMPVLAALVLAACAAEPSPPIALKPDVVRSLKQYTREYVLQPGDQVLVTIFHVPELSSTSTIRPDGYVSLPVVKDVKAGGLTVPEFDAALTRLYGERLVSPDVSATVVNPRAASVFVVGEVNRPGPVAVRDAPTVALALAASGGVPRSASLDNVAVIRLQPDGYLTGTILSRDQSGETAFYMAMQTMSLETGDVVVVPENGRSQFTRFVQDFVTTPLNGVNQILTPYYEFRLIDLVDKARS